MPEAMVVFASIMLLEGLVEEVVHLVHVQFLLELKYLSEAKGTEAAVKSKLSEAKEQLARYREAPNFKDVKNLDCWAIVFVNKEPKAVEKLPDVESDIT